MRRLGDYPKKLSDLPKGKSLVLLSSKGNVILEFNKKKGAIARSLFFKVAFRMLSGEIGVPYKDKGDFPEGMKLVPLKNDYIIHAFFLTFIKGDTLKSKYSLEYMDQKQLEKDSF